MTDSGYVVPNHYSQIIIYKTAAFTPLFYIWSYATFNNNYSIFALAFLFSNWSIWIRHIIWASVSQRTDNILESFYFVYGDCVRWNKAINNVDTREKNDPNKIIGKQASSETHRTKINHSDWGPTMCQASDWGAT